MQIRGPATHCQVCGDALIPDALQALDRLGLAREVLSAARPLQRMRIFAPNGSHVELGGQLASLPRLRLDDALHGAAVAAGARPLRLAHFMESDGTLRGACFKAPGNRAETAIHGELLLLATGAASAPLELAGVCERKEASGIAVRGYFRNETLARELDALCISFNRSICPGYGWIFPGPDGVFNVGAGHFFDAPRHPAVGNVRQVFASFVERFPLARRLLAEAEPLGEIKGAPLRTALKGARLARPGLLVAGEAAGSTYSFSGEGIGKALETGMLAAEHAFDFFSGKFTATALGPAYQQSLAEALAPRFAAYETAQQWLSYPAACDFITARARAPRTIRQGAAGGAVGRVRRPRRAFFVGRAAQGAGGLGEA